MADVLFASSLTADADFTSPLIVFNGALEEIRRDMDSYYKLEEASGTRVDHFGSDDLSPNGTVGQGSPGKIGDCADFIPANAAALEGADSSVHQVGDKDWTASLWMTIDTTSTTGAIISKTTLTPANNGSFQLQYLQSPTNRLRWIVFPDGMTGTIVVANNFGAVPTGTFIHVLVYHDSVNDEVGIRVNGGTPNTASMSGGIFEGAALFRIGAHGNDDTAGPPTTLITFHDGFVDEVGIWSRLLSESEQQALAAGDDPFSKDFAFSFEADADFSAVFNPADYNVQLIGDVVMGATLSVRDTRFECSFTADADFTADVKGVLDGIGTAVDHYWKFEETAGTDPRLDEIDAAGGAINLNDVNTVDQGLFIGNCADFVRANMEELVGSATDLDFDGTADFSILFWASVDDNTSAGANVQGPAVSKWATSDKGWLVNYDQFSDAWEFVVSDDGSSFSAAVSSTFVSTAFAMVYADYDSSTGDFRCSVNNGTKGTNNNGGTTINQSAEPLRVGATRYEGAGGLNDYFDGQIDELIVFNRKLTDAELAAFYAAGSGKDLRPRIVKDFAF